MNSVSILRRNRLGRRLIWQSLLLAASLTVLLTILQVWLDYREEMQGVQDTIRQIEMVQLRGITAALWNFSMPELEAQVDGITHFPYINYAEVSNRGKVVSAAGVQKDNDFMTNIMPIVYQDLKGQQSMIGVLTLQVDTAAIKQDLQGQVVRIFAFQAANILFVLFFFLLLINRQVTRHLNTAAGYFQAMDFQKIATPLKLNKKTTPGRPDEIDSLVAAFNEMRSNLVSEASHRYESERKHAVLLSNLPGMAFQCRAGMSRTMELVSAGSMDLTGYRPEEIIHNETVSYGEMILPGDREMVWQTIQKELAEKQVYELTYRIRAADGQVKWVWEKGIGVSDRGAPAGMIEGFVIDITERKQQERVLEAIAALSYALRSARTNEEMMPLILEQTVQLLAADGGLLELIDPTNGEAVVELASGEYKSMSGDHIPYDKGLNSYIRRTCEPYRNNQVSTDPMSLHPDIDAVCPAVGGAPMIAHGELIGFLWVGRKSSISESAIRTLAAIADISATAIHRMQLAQQTQQRLQRLIGLRKIDTAINNNQDLPSTLGIVLEQAIQLLNVDAAQVVLLDQDASSFHYQAGQGFRTQSFEKLPARLGESSADQAVLKRELVSFSNIHKAPPDRATLDKMRLEGFSAFFAAPLVTKNEVKGYFQVFLRAPFEPGADWVEFLETLAGQVAIAVSEAHLLRDLQHSNWELRLAYDQTIEGWSTALDLRDKETEGHSQRVCGLTLQLAGMLGIQGEELINIRRGALLHDIGKMGVPDQILFKQGPLNREEWQVMYKHPVYAYQLMSPIAYLHPALDIPYCHHEKWDGSGYPRGLKGPEIPLAARIFAVIDVWDALTSDRPYRSRMPEAEVMAYIKDQSGRHFDPEVVKLFTQIMEESETKG